MKIIANDLFGKVIFSFYDEAQWVASYQEKLSSIDFIEVDGDQLIFDFSELHKESSLLEITQIVSDYKDDNPNYKIEHEENIGLKIIEKINTKLKKKENIRISYNNIINDEWDLVELNTSYFLNSFSPYDFQVKHAQNIISKKDSANFSSPGAGKTIISYMAISSLFADKAIQDVVIFGPKSASFAWKKEWEIVIDEKFINKRNVDYLDFSNKNKRDLKSVNPKTWPDSKLNIWFFNFHKMSDEVFVEDLIKKLEKRKFILIIDEAHYIKNKSGKWHSFISILSTLAKYSLILTGTPIPRFASEGNYLLNIIWPGIEHLHLTENDFKNFSENHNLELKKHFKKIFSRKNKKELEKTGELKRINKIDINIEMTKVEQMLLDRINSIDKRENLLDEKVCQKMNKALLIRRMQASSYPLLLKEPLDKVLEDLKEDLMDSEDQNDLESYFSEENKMLKDAQKLKSKQVDSIIQGIITSSKFNEEIARYENRSKIPERWITSLNIIRENNENIIVWDIFRKSMSDFRKYLVENLEDRRIILVNGEVKGKKRIQEIEKFKNSSNAILIASPATIAESVSLHKNCHRAIYLYKNYVGSHWMQSIDRIHRLVSPGDESKEKFIHNIVAKGNSIDKLIMDNLNKKETQQSKLID